ncbi:MAG: hypothetical protein ACYC6T_18775 [Thermoleophilia bacterium]
MDDPASRRFGQILRLRLRIKWHTLHILAVQNAVAGQTSYSYNWTVAQPVGTGYKALVWYVDAVGNWLYYDLSNATFSIQ